jgi:hypothetical protein
MVKRSLRASRVVPFASGVRAELIELRLDERVGEPLRHGIEARIAAEDHGDFRMALEGPGAGELQGVRDQAVRGSVCHPCQRSSGAFASASTTIARLRSQTMPNQITARF